MNLFQYAFVPGLAKGSKVTAGQRIAFMGDSGNAEDAGSHLHFELHQPDGTVINAYQSLLTREVTVRSR